MLNTLYLRTFLAIVDAGNYTAAAEMLHMSQPAVSQHIRALEDQLGDVRLFRRMGQRMVTTHAGEELLVAARELVALAERTEQNIRALRGQVAGRIAVGCTASSGEYLLPGLLAAFRTRFPAVDMTIHVNTSDILLDVLANKHVGLLLIEEHHRRRGFEIKSLGREELLLVAPAEHPMLSQEEVPPGALRDYPIIMPGYGSPLRRIIEDGLRRRGVTVNHMHIALECDSIGTAIQAVHKEIGMAFIPSTRIDADGAPKLGRVALSGAPFFQEWFLLRERGRQMPRALQELYDFLIGPAGRTILANYGIAPPEK